MMSSTSQMTARQNWSRSLLPFAKRDDGTIEVAIMAKSPAKAARHIPNIAAQIGCSEDELLQKLTGGTGSFTTRRPDVVHHPLSFNGPLAVRSMAKSCLVLWASGVGNDLDCRHLPHSEELAQRFGRFFQPDLCREQRRRTRYRALHPLKHRKLAFCHG
jgi:hypothetical protein